MGVEVKKPIIFVEPKGITKDHITLLGIEYTHEEFEVVLHCMKHGLSMYKDKIIHLDSAKEIGATDATFDGYVITKGFANAEDQNDKRVVFIGNDLALIKHDINPFDYKAPNSIFTTVFNDKFNELIMYLIRTNTKYYKTNTTKASACDKSIEKAYAKHLLECPSGITPASHGREVAEVLINNAFQLIHDKFYCTRCGTFAETHRYNTTVKKPYIKDGVETGEYFDEVKKVYMCKPCYAAAVKPRQLKADDTIIGRNDPCLCGSGKKYKKCCG